VENLGRVEKLSQSKSRLSAQKQQFAEDSAPWKGAWHCWQSTDKTNRNNGLLENASLRGAIFPV
jgi:hypothetical protein